MIDSKMKRAILAGFLSWVSPGLGQLYTGSWRKALLFATFCFAPLLSFSMYLIDVPLLLFVWFAMFPIAFVPIIDAIHAARKAPASLRARNFQKIKYYIISFPVTTVGSSLVYDYRDNRIKAYKIPSNSMAPTIIPGDRIAVRLEAYQKRRHKRGDIVVMVWPKNKKMRYVKP